MPNKEVSGFWSPRSSSQTRASAFFIIFCLLWNDVQLQLKLLDRLQFCALCFKRPFAHRGYERLPDLCGRSKPPNFVYGKFGLVPITAYTGIVYFTGWPNQKITKTKQNQKTKRHHTDFESDLWPSGHRSASKILVLKQITCGSFFALMISLFWRKEAAHVGQCFLWLLCMYVLHTFCWIASFFFGGGVKLT